MGARAQQSTAVGASPCAGQRWAFATACARGTGSSTLTYATNLHLIGAEAVLIICGYFPDPSYDTTVETFRRLLPGAYLQGIGPLYSGARLYSDHAWMTRLLVEHRVTHLYMQTHGRVVQRPLRPPLAPSVTLAVHAIFDGTEQWGDTFARISPVVPGSADVVPLSVERIPLPQIGLREQLGIPLDDAVFCSYGGQPSFSIDFVRRVVCSLNQSGISFLFANHKPFCGKATNTSREAPRVHFVRNLANDSTKGTFLKTCDAMLHARQEGESFGRAVAEFSSANLPVFTFSTPTVWRAHLDILGNKAFIYNSKDDLVAKLRAFNRSGAAAASWNAYADYAPSKVMPRFCEVFGRTVSPSHQEPHTRRY